jgi:pimeloyl-ACP methyl ester carboxylesterase
LIGVPKQVLSPTPLLVGFHGYSANHFEFANKTDFFQQAMRRGWIVVSPLGAHEFNYAIDYSQQNTEVMLDWVANTFSIDPERVYGVGFSMGGGSASTYAARHLDPTHARFAAVVDHTGTVSLEDVWTNAADPSLLENPLMFGGPPAAYPFRYQQASVIDLDFTGTIDPAADQGRNLVHSGVMIFAVINDPLQHLVNQCEKFNEHLSSIGGTPLLQLPQGGIHRWSTLDETMVLDWLEPQRFTMPPAGIPMKVLADRDARWHHFTITQQASGFFSPFRWTEDLVNNRMALDKIENMTTIRFDPRETRLRSGPSDVISVMIDLETQSSIDIVLDGYPTNPSSVTRTGGSGAAYTWDPVQDTVTLHETLGGNYARWSVTR